MKKLLCHCCNCYLGEIAKGKLHKKARVLCGACYARMEYADSMTRQPGGNASAFDAIMKEFGVPT